MKKSFSIFSRVAAIVFTIFFVFSLFSCTGLLASTAENGSVSFVLDKAVFNAARSGTNGGEDFSYRVVVSLEDGKDLGLKQTVNITEKDFSDTKKTNGYFEANFPKVPVGKKVYAIVKIFEQFPHHEERDIDNPDADPVMIGKSDVYKIKSGKNQITLKAYNYRYNFPFSITITFDELSESDISALEQDLLITAVAADSDEAKRVAAAGSDKYKIYEALSNSLTGEDQLAKSYGATFTFNQAAKKLTVSGNMLLPINPDEAATKGKDVILVAAMYKYDSSTSKFKAKLFGQSEKITPEKAGTNEVAFAAKKLNVVDTPVVTYSKVGDEYSFAFDGVIFDEPILYNSFCFDADGYFYTLQDSQIISNNPRISRTTIDVTSDHGGVSLIIDKATNILYLYAGDESAATLYKYPLFISSNIMENNNTALKWSFSIDTMGTRACVINNNTLFIIGDNDRLYKSVLDENNRNIILAEGKEIVGSLDNLVDFIALDNSIYMLYKNVDPYWDYKSNPSFPDGKIGSYGALIRYDIENDVFNTYGLTTDKIENTSFTEIGMNVYGTKKETSLVYKSYDGASLEFSNPLSLKGNSILYVTSVDVYMNTLFPTITTPSPLENTLSNTAFYGPDRFIAIKPKKLVIADDGIAFYTDNDLLKYRNVNRIITIDLETFAFSVSSTTATFSEEISRLICGPFGIDGTNFGSANNLSGSLWYKTDSGETTSKNVGSGSLYLGIPCQN